MRNCITLLIILKFTLIAKLSLTGVNGENIVNEKIYSNLFTRRRMEQKLLLRHFQSTDSYEKKFRLLQIGFEKMLEAMNESKERLQKENYKPQQGFPNADELIDDFAIIIENTCLFSELYVHLPDISSTILSQKTEWKSLINWSLSFTSHFNNIVDVNTRKILSVFNGEINPEKRSKSHTNPYAQKNVKIDNVTKKPPKEKQLKTKIKRGPRLTGKVEL